METMREMGKLDISSAPHYKVISAIANHPRVIFPNPGVLAAGMKIEVNQDFVDDKEMFDTAIDNMVSCLNNIYDVLCRDFGVTAGYAMFLAIAKEFSLKYTF